MKKKQFNNVKKKWLNTNVGDQIKLLTKKEEDINCDKKMCDRKNLCDKEPYQMQSCCLLLCLVFIASVRL